MSAPANERDENLVAVAKTKSQDSRREELLPFLQVATV
jgi:hypothetical protein